MPPPEATNEITARGATVAPAATGAGVIEVRRKEVILTSFAELGKYARIAEVDEDDEDVEEINRDFLALMDKLWESKWQSR